LERGFWNDGHFFTFAWDAMLEVDDQGEEMGQTGRKRNR
jgi:hypothetical protein